MEYQSLYELFQGVSTSNSDRPAYRYKKDGAWVELTWQQARALVDRVAKSLLALQVKHGDRVAILSRTRLEWSICDFGIVCCGGVTVGIYPSNLPEDCAYIVEHSDAEVIFVEDRGQLDKIDQVREKLPKIRRLVLLDGESDPDRNVIGWEEFLALGEVIDDATLEERGRRIVPEDMASVVYTSGTTGLPKGAMITHKNLIFASWSAGQCLYLEPHFSTLMFLPLAHVFARLISYCCMRNGNLVAFAEDITTVAAFRVLEPDIRRILGEYLSRGKIDASLRYTPAAGIKSAKLNLNAVLAQRLLELQGQMQTLSGLNQPPDLQSLMRWPGILEEQAIDPQPLHEAALDLLGEAAKGLQAARTREGEQMDAAIRERLNGIENQVAQIRLWLPEIRQALRQKLLSRVEDLQQTLESDRLEQEVAILAQKIDVDEELDRLSAHIKESLLALEREDPVGRRLDFLMQEFNRESNTLSSKSVDQRTTQAAVELKVFIEQMREQVQNIE